MKTSRPRLLASSLLLLAGLALAPLLPRLTENKVRPEPGRRASAPGLPPAGPAGTVATRAAVEISAAPAPIPV